MTGPVESSSLSAVVASEVREEDDFSSMEQSVNNIASRSLTSHSEEGVRTLTPERVQEIKERAHLNPFFARAIGAGGVGVINGDPRIQKAHLSTKYNVTVGKPTDQESSGRCWIFAGLNRMRTDVLEKYGEEFSYSQTYVAFWDKFERCNAFLEKMLELKEERVEGQRIQNFLENGYNDGGEWEMFVNIVEKYGVVPAAEMPETEFTGNTEGVNEILSTRLKEIGGILHKLSSRIEEDPSVIERIQEVKEQALIEVYRVLVSYWGEPPEDFYWKNSDSERYVKTTPMEFYRDNPCSLSSMVHLSNLPYVSFNTRFTVQDSTNVVGGAPCGCLNVSMEDLKVALRASIKDGQASWIECSMAHLDKEKKLLSDANDKIPEFFGFDPNLTLSKGDGLWYRSLGVEHGMLVTGCDDEEVDKVEGEESRIPESLGALWKVENSWGEELSEIFMTDHWFDKHVIGIVVDKKYLPEPVFAALEEETEPLELAAWDPYA